MNLEKYSKFTESAAIHTKKRAEDLCKFCIKIDPEKDIREFIK